VRQLLAWSIRDILTATTTRAPTSRVVTHVPSVVMSSSIARALLANVERVVLLCGILTATAIAVL
jgi:hypothetical protein